MDREVLEKIQKMREDEEAEAARLREEALTLSEEELHMREKEDKHKHPSIAFPDQPIALKLEARDLVILEERVLQNRGDWLLFSRVPNVSEDELNKLKKAKGSKTLNINDLNPQNLRVWIDLTVLSSPGCTELFQRAPFRTLPDDHEFNPVALKDFYVSIRINLQCPIVPVITEPLPTQLDLLPLLDLEKKLSKEQVRAALFTNLRFPCRSSKNACS